MSLLRIRKPWLKFRAKLLDFYFFLLKYSLPTEATLEATQTPVATGATGGNTKLATVPTAQPALRKELAAGRRSVTQFFWSAAVLKERELMVMFVELNSEFVYSQAASPCALEPASAPALRPLPAPSACAVGRALQGEQFQVHGVAVIMVTGCVDNLGLPTGSIEDNTYPHSV